MISIGLRSHHKRIFLRFPLLNQKVFEWAIGNASRWPAWKLSRVGSTRKKGGVEVDRRAQLLNVWDTSYGRIRSSRRLTTRLGRLRPQAVGLGQACCLRIAQGYLGRRHFGSGSTRKRFSWATLKRPLQSTCCEMTFVRNWLRWPGDRSLGRRRMTPQLTF